MRRVKATLAIPAIPDDTPEIRAQAAGEPGFVRLTYADIDDDGYFGSVDLGVYDAAKLVDAILEAGKL